MHHLWWKPVRVSEQLSFLLNVFCRHEYVLNKWQRGQWLKTTLRGWKRRQQEQPQQPQTERLSFYCLKQRKMDIGKGCIEEILGAFFAYGQKNNSYRRPYSWLSLRRHAHYKSWRGDHWSGVKYFCAIVFRWLSGQFGMKLSLKVRFS